MKSAKGNEKKKKMKEEAVRDAGPSVCSRLGAGQIGEKEKAAKRIEEERA